MKQYLDCTLALVIYQALLKFQTVGGCPCTDPEDGLEIHKEDQDNIHNFNRDRWKYILQQMIDAFYLISLEENIMPNSPASKKIDRGLMLFAKYYRALWD